MIELIWDGIAAPFANFMFLIKKRFLLLLLPVFIHFNLLFNAHKIIYTQTRVPNKQITNLYKILLPNNSIESASELNTEKKRSK